ncbi:MAG: restriction endonuclease [Myxococcales bacterium]|nr:restriction endonuclease [Myxococcales bacterium]
MSVSTVPLPHAYFGVLLKLLSEQPAGLRRAQLCDGAADLMQLTAEQRAEALPSGKHLRYRHRIGWSLNLLKNAGLLEAPSQGVWKLSDEGKKFATTHGTQLDDPTSRDIVRRARLAESEEPEDSADVLPEGTTQPPEERIDMAVRELHSQLAKDLLDRLHNTAPSFFEKVVLDLLHALGFGNSTDDLQHVGKTADGGIDGIIALDRLGLEKVYVQAKRWKDSVGRPEVQSFFGALAGRRARNGVFITTSTFTKEAREYAAQVSDSIVLVDGARLASLMIEGGVGITHYRTVALGRIDGDYFDEG